MATTYRTQKDSLDDIDEKGYSEHSDDDESPPNNNFMLQVHRQRRLSFSYSKQSENDIDSDDAIDTAHTPIIHPSNNALNIDNPYLHAYEDTLLKPLTPYNMYTRRHMSNHIRQPTDLLMGDTSIPKPRKLERRHSADKVLSKPSTKHTNSVDYLTRMVISLRSKIATYKEDLRIAGELGQKLFIENGNKQQDIEQYQSDIRTLKHKNDQLATTQRQLLQTTQIDAELTQQLETDLHLQMSTSLHKTSKYEQESVQLREELQRTLNEIRQLQQLNDQQRIEIETLETRNEQISVNAGETIDDLSQELAEEKDGHCNLKHKYQKLRNECTKLKINYEKRGMEIQGLKKQIREGLTHISNDNGTPLYSNEATKSGSKHEVKLLYRQIDNIKDEMEGISKHLDLTKTYLKTMMNCLESSVLLMNELDTNQIYTLCSNARQFLGIEQPPPAAKTSHTPPMLPQEHSAEPPPLPKEDERDEILVPMPREPTPPLKVSNIERMPISVPKVLHHSPSPPPCMPSDDYLNKMPPPIPHMKQPKSIIKHNAILPSVPEKPVKPPPNAPHIPLPPPQTHSKVKLHHTGVMPNTAAPSLPPAQPQPSIPSIPQEVIPNTKSFSSAKPPPSIAPTIPPPQAPGSAPRAPNTPKDKPMKCNTNSKPIIPSNITQKEYNPAVPGVPSHPSVPHVPTPVILPPKTITHDLGVMPVPIVDENPLSVPSIPSDSRITPPNAPQDRSKNKVKISASAMAPPPQYAPPQAPKDTPHAPIMPRAKPMKCNTSSKPILPPNKLQKEYKAPAIPSDKTRVPAPRVPVVLQPKVKTHDVGVMPMPIVDEKLPSIPSIPSRITPSVPSIPQDMMKPKVKLSASAMSPPPNYAPPSVPDVPNEAKEAMESVQSSTQSHNDLKKKKKKKKKKAKDRDSMADQKRHLTLFFSTYSDNKNWTEGKKENGIQKYILRFAEREPLNARMAFLYSMTLYLGQIVGVNKRCISHAFMLFKSVRAQIDTLCEEFALILQTLEHHNDDKLWKYVYSFLYNAAAYFKHIQRFVGTRTSVDNPRKYSRALKAGSRDFTRRRESTFRKLSGLSDASGQSIDYGSDYRYSGRRVYGSANNMMDRQHANDENNDMNKRKTIKVIRK